MDSESGDIIFSGNEGLTCHQFIRAVRERALESGHQRDDEWMADYASIRFEGEALKWFESLEDDTQTSWKLLRRAILSHYEEPAYEVSATQYPVKQKWPAFTFTGKDNSECQEFVREIRLRASQEGKGNDWEWTIELAYPCFAGDALKWHASLPMDVRTNWARLERAILVDYPFSPTQTISPARIRVDDWSTTVAPSASLQSIRTRQEWLDQARERRRMYQEVRDQSTPCWLLVETVNDIPGNALVTGFEKSGEALYSVRAWQDGYGVIVGKCGKNFSGAALPLYGKEIRGVKPFEVLVGDSSHFQWVAVPREGEETQIKHRPFSAVDAGVEICHRHRAAFIFQTAYENGWHPGKSHSGFGWVAIGYKGAEVKFSTNAARLLAWAE